MKFYNYFIKFLYCFLNICLYIEIAVLSHSSIHITAYEYIKNLNFTKFL